MTSLENFLDRQLSIGRAYFSKEEGQQALGLKAKSFSTAANRLIKKHKLALLKRGFYLILRPEDRVAGAPDPTTWIDPLMNYLGMGYRISLLRAAAFHGSSHQAAMVFQVIVPKQLRAFDIGRHRVQFIYQTPTAFNQTNQPEWLKSIKTDAGFAKVSGVELTLLDSVRYFHKAAGINSVAQIVRDLGAKASPRTLIKAASHYENVAVRRLGYLLELFGYDRQADALVSHVRKAKSFKLLDPSIKTLVTALPIEHEKVDKWKLLINESVEIDY